MTGMAQVTKSTDSFRFLDLPPELRLNIYDLVLGGRTIHVGDPSNPAETKRIHACKAATRDSEIRSEDVKDTQDLFVYRHLNCTSANQDDHGPFGSNGLALLSACKQIYRETADIPFSANTFTFCAPKQISRLAGSLTSRQQQAISHAQLYSTGGAKKWQAKPESKEATFQCMLPGLKHLHLYLELCPQDLGGGLRRRGSVPPSYAGDLGNTAQQDLHNAANLDSVFAGLQTAEGSGLWGVDVNVVDTSGMKNYRCQQLRSLDEESVETWKAALKQNLMASA